MHIGRSVRNFCIYSKFHLKTFRRSLYEKISNMFTIKKAYKAKTKNMTN